MGRPPHSAGDTLELGGQEEEGLAARRDDRCRRRGRRRQVERGGGGGRAQALESGQRASVGREEGSQVRVCTTTTDLCGKSMHWQTQAPINKPTDQVRTLGATLGAALGGEKRRRETCP